MFTYIPEDKPDNYVQLMKIAMTYYRKKGEPFEINIDGDYSLKIVILFVFFVL